MKNLVNIPSRQLSEETKKKTSIKLNEIIKRIPKTAEEFSKLSLCPGSDNKGKPSL